MKFLCHFYVYVLIIVFTREIWVIRCSTDFKVIELKYLAERLNPTECLKLLDAVYHRTSFKQKMTQAEKIHKAIRRDFGKSWVTRESCFFQLENWHKHFPGRRNIKGREVMEDALSSLGRPDLARQIRKNRREHFINHIVNYEDFFENNQHDMSRRYASRNGKVSAFNKNKYSQRNGQEKDFHRKIKLEGNDNGKLHPTQVVITGEFLKENHSEITDPNEIKNKMPKVNYDIYWIILITVIALIIMSICATGVFVIYRKNCNRLINGRLCQEWALNQDGKKICVCCCGTRKETSRKFYSDVDTESGWSGRCSKCWLVPEGDNYEKSRSKHEAICMQKPKNLKKKKKQHKTKEKIHKKEGKKISRNKTLEKETKSQKCKRTDISEPSHTDFKGMQNKIACLLKNDCKCCKCFYTNEDQGKCRFFKKKTACDDSLCNIYNLKNITDPNLSSETECIPINRKDKKKKEKSGWSSCDTSPRLKDKKEKVKELKNKEKLFQYDSGSPACSRKTCDWRKIAKEKRYGKSSV